MLPNLIVISGLKCGMTSLHYYLGLHPQITMSREKELDFFIEQRNWHRGLAWYESNFTGEGKVFGESSPHYTNHPFESAVPQRMHGIVPNARLIYVVRDPIERIISRYIHLYAVGRHSEAVGSQQVRLAGVELVIAVIENRTCFCTMVSMPWI